MIETTILAFESSPLTSVALPADILNAAGTLWNSMNGLEPKPAFRVRIVTPDGKPVQGHGTIPIIPHESLENIDATDVLIVSGIGDLRKVPGKSDMAAEKLRQLHARGSLLASICSGAFVLAATGLLDGKEATTHWGMARLFAEKYPRVRLKTRQILTEEDNLLCSGGTTAGADLALALIRKFCGEEEAVRCARVLLLDPNRSTQSPYEQLPVMYDHGDPEIAEVQRWISSNYRQAVTVERLADIGRMSRRTFERRFKKATGHSPLQYLQRVRVESARQLLETTSHSFEEITGHVGYEDTSSFRRIFYKEMGLPPSVYREKFGRRGQVGPDFFTGTMDR